MRRLVFCIIVAWACVSSQTSRAQQISTGAFTNLSSTTEKVISWRCQSRSWLTADGTLHLLANLGAQGLAIQSSEDDGLTWETRHVIENSNGESTADACYSNGKLHVAFVDGSRSVRYSLFDYQSTDWIESASSLVWLASLDAKAEIPSVTVDAIGGIWIAYSDSFSLSSQVKVVYSANGADWYPNGVLGRPHFFRKACKLVSLSNRVGMVIADVRIGADGLYLQWLWCQHSLWPNGDWNVWQIFEDPDAIPFSALDEAFVAAPHFSVLVDHEDNVHLTPAVKSKRVLYLRRSDGSQLWSAKYLTDVGFSTYTQLSANSEDLSIYLTVNLSDIGGVFKSSDAGLSFAEHAVLVHPAAWPDSIDFFRPRIEAPENLSESLPVLQQFKDNESGLWGLVRFGVDL